MTKRSGSPESVGSGDSSDEESAWGIPLSQDNKKLSEFLATLFQGDDISTEAPGHFSLNPPLAEDKDYISFIPNPTKLEPYTTERMDLDGGGVLLITSFSKGTMLLGIEVDDHYIPVEFRKGDGSATSVSDLVETGREFVAKYKENPNFVNMPQKQLKLMHELQHPNPEANAQGIAKYVAHLVALEIKMKSALRDMADTGSSRKRPRRG